MAYPVLDATVTVSSDTQTALTNPWEYVVDMPTTRPDDTLYIACWWFDDGNQVGPKEPVHPNWTTILGTAHTGSGTNSLYVGWRIGSSEPATYDFDPAAAGATEEADAVVLKITGHDAADPIGAVASTTNGVGSTLTAPDATTELGQSLILRVYCQDTDEITSCDDQIHLTGAGGTGFASGAVGSANGPATAGATGTSTATAAASDDFIAVTIEIRSATPPGGSIPIFYYHHARQREL